MDPFQTPTTGEPIGLIAGWGRYPILLAQHLRRRNLSVCCVGIRDHVDAELAGNCDAFQELSLTRLASHVRFFRKHGVSRVLLAGKIHKTLLFQPRFFWKNIPDLACMRTYLPHFISGTRTRNDDALLMAATDGYARYGIEVVKSTDFAPELLIAEGQLCGPALTRAQHRDIEYGWKLAKAMGGLDVGQSVVVKGQAVLAVEAIEGTDECIRRAGRLCTSGGFTVVKVAKPGQDMRFDIPTIGIGTVQTMWQSGGRVLAVEARRTLLVDREPMIRFAESNRISIVAFGDGLQG
jgi:UDP-2,3-diacylglucosamine hydrolase